MIQTVTKSDFHDAFKRMDRADQFSYEALNALHEYYTELEEETGTPIELDVIAIYCDWTEYENLKEVQENYTDIKGLDDLRDHTQVIELDNGGLVMGAF